MRHLLTISLLAASAVAQTWTLTDQGPQCGGDLRGQVVTSTTGQGLRLGISGAQANALAILAIGMPQTTPVALPGSTCLFYVNPRGTQLGLTDAQGRAGFTMRLPGTVPLTFYLQAAIIDVQRFGRVVESTDVLRVDGV